MPRWHEISTWAPKDLRCLVLTFPGGSRLSTRLDYLARGMRPYPSSLQKEKRGRLVAGLKQSEGHGGRGWTMKEAVSECGMSMSTLTRCYREITGKWVGCDWPTRFGPLGLNLKGLHSNQATLIARATCGREAAEWRAPPPGSDSSSRTRSNAEQSARVALAHAHRQQFREALQEVQDACELEAKYHPKLLWQPLCDALARMIEHAEAD